jgi:hypothetical protein
LFEPSISFRHFRETTRPAIYSRISPARADPATNLYAESSDADIVMGCITARA